MSFSHLGLSDKVLAAVAATGYTTPTPIQEQAIPHVLSRRDVLGIAQTGTGKTAAFVLPMLTMLEKGRARARMPRTLILEPTRELAAQVKENSTYGADHKLNVALLIGGVSFGDQDTKLTRGVDVLIATPGRLLDHTERGGMLLTGVELLVIDEADRMLDMGFIPDIERIASWCRSHARHCSSPRPCRRKSGASPRRSCTIRRRWKCRGRRPPTRAWRNSRSASAASRMRSAKRAPPVARRQGPAERDHLLQPQARSRAVAQIAAEARLCRRRAAWRHGSAGPHRGARSVPQRRNSAAGRLRRRRARPRYSRREPYLQFRRAHHADDYVHRIGRTARAGRSGTAISIVTPLDQKSMAAIEKLIGQDIPRAEGDFSAPAESSHDATAARRHRAREGSREGSRDGSRGGRKPRREREPKNPSREREPAPRRNASRSSMQATDAAGRLHQEASSVPSIGRASRRTRRAREPDSEPADHSHLPAFLLRPVRDRVLRRADPTH